MEKVWIINSMHMCVDIYVIAMHVDYLYMDIYVYRYSMPVDIYVRMKC